MSEFPHTRTYPPPRRRLWPWVLAIAALAACFIGTALLYVATTGDPATITTAEATAPAKSAAKGKPKSTIGGDDLVHVGQDVPPGVYRAVEPIEGSCYWMKSKDAEGANIIDNDIPAGGRPQVTLKKGQWFTSRGCPDWAVAK